MKRVTDEHGNEFEYYPDAESPFPWGRQPHNPGDGFKVGDRVGLIYSDHDEYIFDNPEGVVVAVEGEWDPEMPEEVTITVDVRASLGAHRVYLIARPVTKD